MGIQYVDLEAMKQKQLLDVSVKNADTKTTPKKQRKSNKK